MVSDSTSSVLAEPAPDPYTLHPTHYTNTLHTTPTPCTLHTTPKPCTLHPAPCTLTNAPPLQDVKTRIRDEFQRTRTDPACQEAYSSFQYLHEKLAHIKKLVHEYDQARVAGRR